MRHGEKRDGAHLSSALRASYLVSKRGPSWQAHTLHILWLIKQGHTPEEMAFLLGSPAKWIHTWADLLILVATRHKPQVSYYRHEESEKEEGGIT